MRFKAVLFDFDGTLANSTDIILAGFHKACLEVLGHDVDEKKIIRTFGLTLKAGMEVLAERPEQVDNMRTVYREYFYANHEKMFKALPEVYNTIKRLYELGIKMAVVTSKTSPTAIRDTECVHLDQYISAIVSCSDVANPKPAPDAMLEAMRQLGVKPEECLCVGDSPFDLQSGHNAGAKAAAVKYTLFDWQQMINEGKPDYVLEKFSDLLHIVAGTEA